MANFLKITTELFQNDSVLEKYLGKGIIALKPAHRGGVFYATHEVAPPEMKKYGIILPHGGMIFPDQTVKEIKEEWTRYQENKKQSHLLSLQEYLSTISGGRAKLTGHSDGPQYEIAFRGEVITAVGMDFLAPSWPGRGHLPTALLGLDEACVQHKWTQADVLGLARDVGGRIESSGYPLQKRLEVMIGTEEVPLARYFGGRHQELKEIMSGESQPNKLIVEFERLLDLAKSEPLTTRGDIYGHTSDGTTWGVTKYYLPDGQEVPFEVIDYLKK